MEFYRTAYALDPAWDLPPTPTTYNSLPIHGEERLARPIPELVPVISDSQNSSLSLLGGGLLGRGEKKTAKDRLKQKVKEKREKLRNQKNITPHSNSLPQAFYDLSTSSSLTEFGMEQGCQKAEEERSEESKTMLSQKQTKKVRVVCISDTHNQTPARLPPGDVFIHAGDLTNSGTYKELSRAAEWLRNLKGYEHKIVLPGNHDLGLDKTWVEDFGGEIGVGLQECLREGERTWEECIELFAGEEARNKNVVYLGPALGDYDFVRPRNWSQGDARGEEGDDEVGGMAQVKLSGEECKIPGKMEELRLRSGVKFTVWGCPGIPRIMRPNSSTRKLSCMGTPTNPATPLTSPHRQWAFGYSTPPSLEESCWANIPVSGIDILVTHTPPRYHLDTHDSSSLPVSGVLPGIPSSKTGLERAKFLGCEYLRRALWKTRPKLHVFGHIHEGRGAQVVRWDTDNKWIQWREERVVEWVESGGKKMSLVDLTGRGRDKTEAWKVVVEGGRGIGGEEHSDERIKQDSCTDSQHNPDEHITPYVPTGPRPTPRCQLPGQPTLQPPTVTGPETPPPSTLYPSIHPSVLPSIIPAQKPSVFKRKSKVKLQQREPQPEEPRQSLDIPYNDIPPLPASRPNITNTTQYQPAEGDATTSSGGATPNPVHKDYIRIQLVPGKETCLVNASYAISSYYSRKAIHAATAAAARVRGGGKSDSSGGGSIVNKPVVVDLELEVDVGWAAGNRGEIEEQTKF